MKTIRSAVLLMGLFIAVGNAAAQQKAETLVDGMILDWLRVVEDPDGRTNVRSGPSTKDKVVGQVASGSVVAVLPDEAKEGWDRLDDESEEEEHYIHSSRLKKVHGWKQFGKPEAATDGESAVLKQAGSEVRIKSVPFRVAEHKITKDENGLQMVDGGTVWGQDGGLPGREIDLRINLGGKDVVLPKEALQNVYEPSMEFVYLLTPGDPASQALLIMLNGDGAGAYCVVWAFQDGVYKGRAVFVPF